MQRFFVTLGLAVLFVACSSLSTHDSSKTDWQNFTYSEPVQDQSRVPSASGGSTDYLREIEDAPSAVKAVAAQAVGVDPSLLDAKARMEKLFDFARHQRIPFFTQLRRERPIFVSKGGSAKIPFQGVKTIPDIYVITRHADVEEVLNHHAEFSVRPYSKIMDPTVGSAYMLGRENSDANMEKPGMRESLYGHGDPVVIQEKIRRIVQHLAKTAITTAAKDGHIDIAKDVTRAVPLGLNDEFFGFNGPSTQDMARWSRATQHAFFHNPFQDKKVQEESIQAGVEMREYISNYLIPERTRELAHGRPANDTVSQIIQASKAHAKYGLKAERIIPNVIGLLVGSVETTTAAMNQSLEYIINRPTIFEVAKEAAEEGNDTKLSQIVWEALRFNPVNPWLARYAEKDFTIARGTDREVTIKKGSLVLASTASAMFDEAKFPNPTQFRLDRDPKSYMHLGYVYHRCLGDDVALVMVPETIKQILLIKGLRSENSKVDQKKGPFPESYVLALDQNAFTPNPLSLGEEILEGGRNAFKYLELVKFVGGKIADDEHSLAIVKAIKDSKSKDVLVRRKAIEDLPGYVESATRSETAQEKVDACMNVNPKSKEAFPDPTDRANYCKVRMDFRGCYFVQRLLNKQSSFASYHYCVYNRQLLKPEEIASFKSDFSHLEMFYFLRKE